MPWNSRRRRSKSRNPADTPLSGSVGASGWSRAQPALHPGRRKDSLSAGGKDPTFQNQLRALDPVTLASTPRSRLSCLEVSEPPRETQSRGSPLFAWESASQRCAFPPATKAPLRGRSSVRSYQPGAPATTRSGAPIPNCPTPPASSTHFSPVPPFSTPSPPPPHSASEALPLPDGRTKIASTPSLIPAGRSTGLLYPSLPRAAGRRRLHSSAF